MERRKGPAAMWQTATKEDLLKACKTDLQKQCASVSLRQWKGVPVFDMTDDACREFLDIRARNAGLRKPKK